MAFRVRMKDLEMLVDQLNNGLNRPAAPYTKIEGGGYKPAIGNFHLSAAYGGYALYMVANERGGVVDVFNVGHIPKRELYDRINSYNCLKYYAEN